jgi:hypothetical protein
VSIRFPAAAAAANASAAVGAAGGVAIACVARRRARVMMGEVAICCFLLDINGARVESQPLTGHYVQRCCVTQNIRCRDGTKGTATILHRVLRHLLVESELRGNAEQQAQIRH